MNMRNPFFRISLFAATLLFLGAGCISFSGSGDGGNKNTTGDGGIFKTTNKGDAWTTKNAVVGVGGARTIAGVNIVTLVQDPQDAGTFYVGTGETGLLFTLDSGESWTQVGAPLTKGRIPSVSVHPKNKCIIFAAFENKVMKSQDCARTWTAKYLNDKPDKAVTAVVVDYFNPQIIWAASTTGDVVKSTDGGESWANVKNFNTTILRLVLHPGDSRRMYVSTKNAGLWRTDDGGVSWKDLTSGYSKYDGARSFADIAVTPAAPNAVVFASNYGLLRSTDNGDTWSPIALLTAPNATSLYSVAIDPRDANTLYYGTTTTFYRTNNGGTNWTPKKLPTSRAATSVLVDRSNSGVVYMGVTKLK